MVLLALQMNANQGATAAEAAASDLEVVVQIDIQGGLHHSEADPMWRTRPIVGETQAGTGTTDIVVGAANTYTMQFQAIDTVTYDVATTVQNILFDGNTANVPADSNRYISADSAEWETIQASTTSDVQISLGRPIFAIRITISAGSGSVAYHLRMRGQ